MFEINDKKKNISKVVRRTYSST